MKNENEKILSQIEKFINTHNRFFLGSHVFPDGDNIASLITMKFILEQLGKSAYLYCETIIPKIYSWIEETKHINTVLPDEPCDTFDAIITVDSSDIDRLGPEFKNWYNSKPIPILNVDHHVTNTNFGEINWVSGNYSSTAEQVYEIAKYLNVKITKSIAVVIYTGIVTDTGRFSYSNTNARSLRYATELVEMGVNPNLIYRNVFANRTLSALRLERDSLATMEYIEDLQLAYIFMTKEMIERSGASIEESEGIIEHIGLFGYNIKNIIFFKEVEPCEIKVSVRTKGDWDASKLCSLFDGGGHPRAGGYQMQGTLEKAIEKSLETIREAAKDGSLLGDYS
ncbi:bifunctional oligoribonuclease/PAP phosphatase NrnA [bacterium]|nr:bifunctional oligoribonuclease/PAP phosphatase NrnA [bacterium]